MAYPQVTSLLARIGKFTEDVRTQRLVYRSSAIGFLRQFCADLELIPRFEVLSINRHVRELTNCVSGIAVALEEREINKREFVGSVANLSNIVQRLANHLEHLPVATPVVAVAAGRGLHDLDLDKEEAKEIAYLTARVSDKAQLTKRVAETKAKYANWRKRLGKNPDNPVLTREIMDSLHVDLDSDFPIPVILTDDWLKTMSHKLVELESTKRISGEDHRAYLAKITKAKATQKQTAHNDSAIASLRSGLVKSLSKIPRNFPTDKLPPYIFCHNLPIVMSAHTAGASVLGRLLASATLEAANITSVNIIPHSFEQGGGKAGGSFVPGVTCLTHQTCLCVSANFAADFHSRQFSKGQDVPDATVGKMVLSYAASTLGDLNKLSDHEWAIVSERTLDNQLVDTRDQTFFVWLMPMHTYSNWLNAAGIQPTNLLWDIWTFSKR